MTLTTAFIGKLKKPTRADLTKALGPTKSLWDQLLAELADQFDLTDQEWISYSPKYGWSLRLKRKKRNILYLAPYPTSIYVAFILGDKAVKAACHSKLPKRVIKIIDAAKKYPEGTMIRLELKKHKDIDIVKKLTAIKLDN
jgi:hypothetical protein